MSFFRPRLNLSKSQLADGQSSPVQDTPKGTSSPSTTTAPVDKYKGISSADFSELNDSSKVTDGKAPEQPEEPAPHVPVGPEDFIRIKLLGKGDVGKVYLVRERHSGTLYAMKVLTKQEMISRNKVKRVMTEREILATADFPFIVTLYYSFHSSDRLYFVMEYCAGGELFKVLQRQPNKCFSEETAKFYAAEVLLALQYLHANGFIYRDLKPENILLHESGHIRLTDFDLSKQAAATPTPHVVQSIFSSMFRKNPPPTMSITLESGSTSFVGTEEYIAPEVITGFGHTSDLDWWTFGIFLYEILFGKTPFKGPTTQATFQHILHEPLHIPDCPPVSKNCKDLIKRLLEHSPEKRLGHKHGASDVMKHPWFKGMNWSLILNAETPIRPQLSHELDTSHFTELPDSDDDTGKPMRENDVFTKVFIPYNYDEDHDKHHHLAHDKSHEMLPKSTSFKTISRSNAPTPSGSNTNLEALGEDSRSRQTSPLPAAKSGQTSPAPPQAQAPSGTTSPQPPKTPDQKIGENSSQSAVIQGVATLALEPKPVETKPDHQQ